MHLSSWTYEIYINSKAIASYKLKLICSNQKMTSDVPTDWSCISLSYPIIWLQINASSSSCCLLVHQLLLAWWEYHGKYIAHRMKWMFNNSFKTLRKCVQITMYLHRHVLPSDLYIYTFVPLPMHVYVLNESSSGVPLLCLCVTCKR